MTTLVDSTAPNAEFLRCYEVAAKLIEERFFKPNKKENFVRWLKFMPQPPFLEHISFRIGNQLFLVRIVDVDGNLIVPGASAGVYLAAEEYRGVPLILSMRKKDGVWAPTFRPGSEFFDPRTSETVDPLKLVTSEKIEMSDWEVHDYAVQIVRDKMHEAGAKIASWQGYLGTDPSIWFSSEGQIAYAIVRAVRFPREEAPPPENFLDIYRGCKAMTEHGYFASVAIASTKDKFGVATAKPTSLYRGEPLRVKYDMRSAADVEMAHFRSTAQ